MTEKRSDEQDAYRKDVLKNEKERKNQFYNFLKHEKKEKRLTKITAQRLLQNLKKDQGGWFKQKIWRWADFSDEKTFRDALSMYYHKWHNDQREEYDSIDSKNNKDKETIRDAYTQYIQDTAWERKYPDKTTSNALLEKMQNTLDTWDHYTVWWYFYFKSSVSCFFSK